MALRNRVTPLGELIPAPARGLVYGNRGCLHDDGGTIRRRWAVRRWIACRLEFKGWQRGPMMQPGKFTELFFVDEATAFAAGHRPCALCRREDYVRVLEITGEPGADALDARLHAERTGVRPVARTGTLPDGAFVFHDVVPHIVLGGTIRPWSFGGYGRPVDAPPEAELITPPTLVEVLRAGWNPVVTFVMGLAAAEDGTSGPGDRG